MTVNVVFAQRTTIHKSEILNNCQVTCCMQVHKICVKHRQ